MDFTSEPRGRIVGNPRVARRLLKAGYQIIDIKPDKADDRGLATVFVFKPAPDLENAIIACTY